MNQNVRKKDKKEEEKKLFIVVIGKVASRPDGGSVLSCQSLLVEKNG